MRSQLCLAKRLRSSVHGADTVHYNTPKSLVEDSAFRELDQQSFVVVITMASLSLGWGTS